MDNLDFSKRLLAWFDQYGRKQLPWQHPKTAYRVWISEIMLQQTQVQTVIDYFIRFTTRFPSIGSLAQASDDDILAQWSGLGYYSRARNIGKTARLIYHQMNNHFPNDMATLQTLPGIGPSTAAAIASLAFNQSTAILDGNVKRVLSRYFMVDGYPNLANVQKKLWQLARLCMPPIRCSDYTQAIMDLGATLCTQRLPKCDICPLQSCCQAYNHQCVAKYPYKKIKKVLPIKEQQFLLIYDKNRQIYLEKRPSSGLWGGLWGLPIIEMNQSCAVYIGILGFNYIDITPLPQLKHTFTHFHLNIFPRAISVDTSNFCTLQEKIQGFSAERTLSLGLAKPVRDIINFFIKTYDKNQPK